MLSRPPYEQLHTHREARSILIGVGILGVLVHGLQETLNKLINWALNFMDGGVSGDVDVQRSAWTDTGRPACPS